jgi:hypothetical protein
MSRQDAENAAIEPLMCGRSSGLKRSHILGTGLYGLDLDFMRIENAVSTREKSTRETEIKPTRRKVHISAVAG